MSLSLAVILYDEGAPVDDALAEAARRLQAEGRRLGGVVQSSRPRPGRARCDMWLADLFTGEEVRISQDLGPGSTGCRLDLEGLARAHVLIDRALAAGVEGLIINRFGKQEAEGRGFRDLIAEALGQGLPVVLAAPRRNLAALTAFAGTAFAWLPCDAAAVLAWWSAARAEAGKAAEPDRRAACG